MGMVDRPVRLAACGFVLCHACLTKLQCSIDRAGDATAVSPIRRAELARAELKLFFFCYKTCSMKVFDDRLLEVLTAPIRPNEREPASAPVLMGCGSAWSGAKHGRCMWSNSRESNLSAGLRVHSVA